MQLQLLVCAYVYCGDPEGEKTKEIVQRRKTPRNKYSHEYSAITESTSGTCCRQGRKTDIEGGMGGEVRCILFAITSWVYSTSLRPSYIPKQNISTRIFVKRSVKTIPKQIPRSARESCCVHSLRPSRSSELTRVICRRAEYLRIQLPYRDLGSVRSGIVEVLTVVPVSSGEAPVADVDGC